MPETITNPYMNFSADFYRRDVALGAQAILRRRTLAAELQRARERLREEQAKLEQKATKGTKQAWR